MDGGWTLAPEPDPQWRSFDRSLAALARRHRLGEGTLRKRRKEESDRGGEVVMMDGELATMGLPGYIFAFVDLKPLL